MSIMGSGARVRRPIIIEYCHLHDRIQRRLTLLGTDVLMCDLQDLGHEAKKVDDVTSHMTRRRFVVHHVQRVEGLQNKQINLLRRNHKVTS